MATPQEKGKAKEQQPARPEPSKTGESAPVPYRGEAPARYGGWGPFQRLREDFDRLFDQFFRGWSVPWEGGGGDWRWGLDVQERDDAVVVRAEAPGFEPADFDLQVRGDRLILHAAHKAESAEKEAGYREWRQQEFYRSVSLPPGIDADKVEAHYRNGVLTVTVPRTENGQTRRITVKD